MLRKLFSPKRIKITFPSARDQAQKKPVYLPTKPLNKSFSKIQTNNLIQISHKNLLSITGSHATILQANSNVFW